LYYGPAENSTRRGSVLYVHPFGEEMNKSRRMAALQARQFAELGYAVLLIDLHGCGDSVGDFSDARWEIWKSNLATALAWLKTNAPGPISLWGLRLGASLALDFAAESGTEYAKIVLWQPIVNGETFLGQLLRLAIANQMLTNGKATRGTEQLRKALEAGETLEIGGYELSSHLAKAIAGIELTRLAPVGSDAYWLEVASQTGQTLSPSAQRVAESWRAQGISLHTQQVVGESFWTTQEISECPALLSISSKIMATKNYALH